MAQTQLPVNRTLVGVLAMVCLAAGAVIGYVESLENVWCGSFIRTGLLLGAFWIALPSRGREAAVGERLTLGAGRRRGRGDRLDAETKDRTGADRADGHCGGGDQTEAAAMTITRLQPFRRRPRWPDRSGRLLRRGCKRGPARRGFRECRSRAFLSSDSSAGVNPETA